MNNPLITARVGGYSWALSQPEHADYDETASYDAFAKACIDGTPLTSAIPGDETVMALWEAWEQGVQDADTLLRDDALLTVAQIVQRTGFNRAYVQAELKEGNLKGQKLGSMGYVVHPSDFREWMNNPRRGSRSKSE